MELLHICVRRTLPWHDEAAVAAALDSRMHPRVELWNATFDLRYADDSPRGYHWNRYVLEAPRRARRWSWGRRRRAAATSRHTCGSNNYAIRNLPELAAAIPSHRRASQHFDAHPGRVKRLDASLSVQNRNLASRTTLAESAPDLTRDQLLEKYRRYRRLCDRSRLPREVAWADPCMAAMADLVHQLRPK